MSDPTSDDQPLLDALRLNLLPGIGPRLQQALLDHFGSPAAVFAADFNDLRNVDGIGQKLARGICGHRDLAEAETELADCRARGVTLFLRNDEAYPQQLREIHDPPSILYCNGTIEPRDNLAIAIVGSRRCTLYGKQQAERIGSELARAGVTVVSGLARGIDAAAHRGAIAAGGRTFAVTATGLAKIYPPEHAELAQEVSRAGAVLTESCLQQQPIAGLFPQRNRIISGLSLGVLIIEAARSSGALHTARHAMEQGRDVFALPGRVDSLASEGCHDLIRDGATLVRNVDDILESLGPLVKPTTDSDGAEVHSPRELTLNDQEREILRYVTVDQRHIEEILRASELEPSRVLSTLTVLEMKRMVRRLPGGYFVRPTF
jgi:DNA processing protein